MNRDRVPLPPGYGPEPPSAVALARAVAQGARRAEDCARDALERIARAESALRAWETLDAERTLADARALDRALASGAAPGVLAGVPLGVKDIVDVAGWPTGCGTPIHRGGPPKASDAAAVARLRAAGAIVAGKTVTTELAYFTPGPTRNPHAPGRTPGGSSSGSAAAVAAGLVPLALGTQTAGSLIRPASFCGVFALKPAHGALPLDGVKAFAPSLDTLGGFARDAHDLELLRCALAGEPFAPLDVPEAPALRLAVVRTHEEPLLDAGGQAAWSRAKEALRRGGVAVREAAMPDALAGLVDAQKTVMAFEAARSLAAEWQAHRQALSEPLRALVATGLGLDDAAHAAALEAARAALVPVRTLLDGVDALLVPAAPGEAPAGLDATGDPAFNRVWTLLGLPAVNVPGLRGPLGLPIGMQLVGARGDERRLLAVAACVHRLLDGA